jgi:hypothetical protein
VRRIEGDCLTQVVQRLFQRLIRQAVHQVEVKATQTESGGEMGRPLGFVRAVDPA